jgi:RHS repeat-associated protein
MRRIVCLLTTFALALQATGLALSSPGTKGTGSMTNVTFTYDDADRQKTMVDGTGTTEWFYDLDGHVNKMISPQGTMEYDNVSTTGRFWKLIEKIPGQADIVTTYDYDENGQVDYINKFSETTTFVYDDASRPERMNYANGTYAKYTYDGRSRITAVEHFNSSNALLRKETNEYDPASRITSRYAGPATGGVTTTFGYDDIGQLESESDTGGYSASYTYDDNGNRATKLSGGVTETYTCDDADKLTSVTYSNGTPTKTYQYHFSGRCTSVTQGGVTTALTYDKASRPTLVDHPTLPDATYAYNGFDARVSKTVGSTTTTYKRAGPDPVSPVLSDVVGSTTTRHLPGISSRVGSTSTFSHSGIKNGILQTNSSQSNIATKRYDAFGNQLATSGTWNTQFSYGAPFDYQTDPEFGLQLLGHRYYDSSTGRFLSRDPIKDGRNWYTYCENDPVGFADPTGNQMLAASTAVMAVEQSKRIGSQIGDRAWWPSDFPVIDPLIGALKKILREAYMNENNNPNWTPTANKNTDCGVFVKASVGPYDPSFPQSGTSNISRHLARSRLWKLLRQDVPLRPGDVMVITGAQRGSRYGHTAVVGSDGRIHEASLGDHGPRPRNRGSFGDIYRPTPFGFW